MGRQEGHISIDVKDFDIQKVYPLQAFLLRKLGVPIRGLLRGNLEIFRHKERFSFDSEWFAAPLFLDNTGIQALHVSLSRPAGSEWFLAHAEVVDEEDRVVALLDGRVHGVSQKVDMRLVLDHFPFSYFLPFSAGEFWGIIGLWEREGYIGRSFSPSCVGRRCFAFGRQNVCAFFPESVPL